MLFLFLRTTTMERRTTTDDDDERTNERTNARTHERTKQQRTNEQTNERTIRRRTSEPTNHASANSKEQAPSFRGLVGRSGNAFACCWGALGRFGSASGRLRGTLVVLFARLWRTKPITPFPHRFLACLCAAPVGAREGPRRGPGEVRWRL